MGPLFFRAENAKNSVRSPLARRLQWGRSFSERRTCDQGVCRIGVGELQWGRSFSERRTWGHRRARPPHQPGFNGAALFQSGEPAAIWAMRVGRCSLQWGRSFSERRTLWSSSSWSSKVQLQWGRSFSERRTPRRLRERRNRSGASMGPLFFRAENGILMVVAERHQGLQWGRSFSERRTSRRPSDCHEGSRSFNGAALFQSGEPSGWAGGGAKASWLQWGRSFSERRTLRHPLSVGNVRTASMGPLFFRAENFTKMWNTRECDGLQWGRSFSERRTSRHASSRPPTNSLQWGRSFSERRTRHFPE